MSFKNFLAAAIFASAAPFAASAAVVTGDFTEGGTVNTLTGLGTVGTANIAFDGTETDASFVFTFEVDPAASVSGFGTIRATAGFEDLVVTFGGSPVSSVDGPFGTTSFGFGPLVFDLGETFDLIFSFSSVTSTDNIDFQVDLEPVPVPAAGLMLLTALGAGSLVARRRKS